MSSLARDPEWRLPDYPKRIVFVPPEDAFDYVLVRIPSASVTGNLFCVALDSSGTQWPCCRIAGASEDACVLTQIPTTNRKQRISVYFGGVDNSGGLAARSNSMSDPLPVHVEIRRGSGRGIPNTWPNMLYLQRNSRETDEFHCSDFGNVGMFSGPTNDKHNQSILIVHAQSLILCPTQGIYRFALDCKDAGFMFVDGENVASKPGEHAPGEWSAGSNICLTAGIHKVEIYNCCGCRPNIEAGWSIPGDDNITSIPRTALLTGTEAENARIENMTQPLFPDFSFEMMPAYSIRGTDSVFIPVRFRNTTESLLQTATHSHWSVGSEHNNTNGTLTLVLTNPAVYQATLDVRDSLGFTGTCTRMLDCRFVEPKACTLSADVVMLPPVCYENDVIEPVLRVSGSFREAVNVDIQYESMGDCDKIKNSRKVIKLKGDQINVPLVKTNAGALASVQWRLIHAGVDIASGAIRFIRPPFPELPARIEGDHMFGRDGGMLVLLPCQVAGKFHQSKISIAGGRNLLYIDGSGCSIVSGEPKDWKLSFSGNPAESEGREPVSVYGPMRMLLDVGTVSTSGVDAVVMNVGCRGVLERMDPAEFERDLAAVIDMVSSTMKIPVILMTPFPSEPDPSRARSFAAAIVRVAVARGIPVADVYSAFMGSGGGMVDLFSKADNLELSEHGQRFVAALIARCLAMNDPYGRH